MMKTVKVNDLEFEVSPDGDVYQPHAVPPQVLDEVRLAAAGEYLTKPLGLSMAQYRAWAAIRQTNPEHKRFH